MFGVKQVYGLETESPKEFCDLLRNLPEHVGYKPDVVVLVGGDGTFHHGINELKNTCLAFLPLGSGNFLKFTFGLKNSPIENAKLIMQSKINSIDIVKAEFNNTSILSTYCSIGVEADAINISEKLRKNKVPSLVSYGWAAPITSTQVKILTAKMEYNKTKETLKFISLAIHKSPYVLKMGTNINPNAKLDDGLLHLTMFEDVPSLLMGYVEGTINVNTTGKMWTAGKLKVRFPKKVQIQAEGNYIGEAKEFEFKVLPKKIKVKHEFPK